MFQKQTEKPMYLLIAAWVMAENRWVTAREISEHFEIPHSNAVNMLSYILTQVHEIVCETKIIPNQLTGRGCQCKRLVKVKKIDPCVSVRLKNQPSQKTSPPTTLLRLTPVPPVELNHEQKWRLMLSKSQRR